MNLASAQYGLFLAGVCLLSLVVPYRRVRWLLLAASLLFYASGRLTDLLVLAVVAGVSFVGAQVLDKNRSAWKLWLCIIPTVAPLVFLKFSHLWQMPVGVSFFTLQAVAYVVDVYYRRVEPETSLPHYSLFLTFFPLILSGPIERAAHLMPQIRKPGPAQLTKGVFLIAKGVVIKCVFADNFAIFVNDIYGRLASETSANALLACYLYSFQIYCDFYGYTLIALGSAALLGVELIHNFEHPYLAANIQDFWSRWHISLTNWLRDYIYFPLGGLRKSVNRYRNLLVTWLVAGLWHGSGVTFLIWGAMQGGALSIYHFFRSSLRGNPAGNPTLARAVRVLGWFVTFHFVVLSWIPFRADSWPQAQIMFRMIWQSVVSGSLTSPSHPYLVLQLRLAGIFILVEILDWLMDFEKVYAKSPAFAQAILLVLWCSLIYLAPVTDVKFIYAQF